MDRSSFVAGGLIAGATIASRHISGAASLEQSPDLVFRSSFWVNLHHRLYRQSVATLAVRSGEKLRGTTPQLYAELSQLAPSDLTIWNSALATYEQHYAKHDLLFDGRLSSYYETLTRIPDSAKSALNSRHLPQPLVTALAAAAPIYRQTYWTADRVSNSRWTGGATRNLSRYGRPFAQRLAALYQTRWRAVPYRIDVVRYSNWAEAYTENEPGGVYSVIGSAAPDNAGRNAVETIFHEASHSLVSPYGCPVADAIERSSKAAHHDPPDGLWHAVIFYTVGRVAQQLYAAAGEPGYEMFADRAGLWSGEWSRYRPALATHWEQYIAGKVTLTSALIGCVDQILGPSSKLHACISTC